MDEFPFDACGHWLIAGGTFALYSKLCRNMNIGILSRKYSNSNSGFSPSILHNGTKEQSALGKFFERSIVARRVLLFIAILGMCMLIGDGILTPAISGLVQCHLTFQQFWCSFCLYWFSFSFEILIFSSVSNVWNTRTLPFCP